MVDGGAVVGTEHVNVGSRGIVVRVRGEDDVPFPVEDVEFGGPEVGRVWEVLGRVEGEFLVGVVPFCESFAAEDGDVGAGGVGHVVVVFETSHPGIRAEFVQDWVRIGGIGRRVSLILSRRRLRV